MEDNKNKTKVDLMYDDLHEQGYLEKDRDTFNKFFYAPGEQGYKNRKALYDDLHEQGYLESPTYEDFARGIGLHAADRPQQQPSSTNASAAASGVVGGVSGGLTPGSYAQAYAQGTQGNGRPDMVESLNKYYEGMQAQNTPQAPATTKQPEAPAPSTGGSSNAPKSSAPKMVRQEDLYVDDKGNPVLGYTKEDAQEIERSELYYPLMKNDSINVRNTQAFRKGWLTAPQYEKNRKYNEAQAAGYKAQGEKFKNLTDQQLVQAMREEEKKLDGSTSPEALQASMNVTYIETLMAAREWGLGDVAGLNANPHMVDYHMARDYYNKNGLVDKYEKNMLTGRDDNPLLIRGWELIEEQYAKDEAEGNHHKSSYYRNLPFHDPKFAEEFGAYITARIKATGERWNDAVKDAIDDFEAAAEEGRVGQRHSEEYLGSANREQVDDMLDQVNSALKKRTGELDDKFMNKSWFQRMGESSLDPESPSSRYLNDPDAANLIWAGRALQDAKKIIAAFDANRLEDGLTGFFKGAGRGLVDSLGDLSTWDGGISDLLSAQRLDAAVDKFKKGKPLSASEKALLEATSLKLATAEIFKEVGRGYKAGTVTGESLPFMVEMALNPIAKSGDKIASGLARYANKYLGKYLKKMVSKLGRSSAGKIASKIIGSGATKTAGKVAARVVGDIAAAGGMSTTSGVGHSLANTIGYHSGDVQYQQGAGGKTHLGDVKGGDDWVTATLKGFASTTIENASEMWGEYFKPITNFLSSVGGKTLEKMHLGRINKWLSDLNSTEMARLAGDFRKQTRWDGSIAEYFEEVAGNIANALTVKDMNFALTDKNGKLSFHEEHSVFNAQDNLDTFLGVSLMSGAMSTAKIVGYRTPTYRAKQDVKRYGDMAKRIFGGHGNDWSTIANLIQDNSEEARKQLVVDLMQSGKYSKREKQIALQYAGAVYKSMGMDLGESKQKRSAGDQEASDAYGRGYNMANLENISETSGVYNQLRTQMEQEYGTELMERMDKEPGLVYGWVRAGAVSEEDAQKVLNYLNAKMAYDGAMDRLNDDDAAAKAAAEAHVDDTIHTEENGGDGQIHPVALKGRKGDFFVVSGNVVADNDGNVDVEASDNDIVVVDSDGNRIMTNAKNIDQVGEAIDPEAAKADAVAQIDGATQEVVNGENGISEEESVESPEAAEDTDLEDETQVESTTPEATTGTDATQAPLAVEEYNQDDLVTVEVDGQQVTGIITNGLDNDGNVTIYFDEPINGRQNWQMTPEQLNKVAVSYTSRDGVKIDRSSEVGSKKEEVGETPQPQQQQTLGAPVQEQAPVSGEVPQAPAVPVGEEQAPNAPAEAPQQAPAQPSLPVGEDGNADFSNASVQEAHDYIYNDPELDEDEANQTVQNYADAAAEELAKAQAVLDELKSMPAPQMKDYGRDTAGYKRDKKQRNDSIAQAQAAVDAAQRDVDLWKGVQAQHMMSRAAANAAANREENPAAPSAPAPASGENENNAPTPSQATPAQGQQTTESTQEPSAPQPNEENGPMASTTPSSSEEERGESEEAAEQPTTTADERIENARIARLIQRAEQLAATCGIPVRICKSEDEIPARYKKAFETAKGEGKKKSFVNGFFYHKKTANGELNEIVLYIPDIAANGGMWRLERTFLHEAVAHGGLRALFENAQDGIQTFNDLCDKVWNEIMPSGEKRDKRDYVLQNKYGAERYEEIKKQYRKEGKSLDDLMTDELKREAADEYMAHLAEEGTDKTLLEKVVQAVRDALRKIKLIDKKFNDMDIVDLLAASRRNLTEMDRQILNQDVADELDRLALAGEDNGGSTLMSTTSIMEGGGLEVSREVVDKDGKVTKEPLVDEEGNLVARYNGKEYSAKNPITADDLREGDVEGNEATVLQMLINDARDAKNISDKQAAKIYQNYADMINLFLKCGSAENGGADTVMENWEWLGDTVFKAVAANGDAQYSYSMDITKVCKKNEAVIKSISALQLREGRGATPSEIVEIYRDTHVEGYQVPCPVCYVFTRYIRNGKYASAAITGMEEYGEHLPGGKNPWTLKQWRDELNRLDRTMNPDSKQKRTDAEKEQAKRFKKQLDEANDITVYYEDRVNALSFLLTSKFTSEARKKEILEELKIIDAQYKAAVNIIARQSLTNWIKTFAIQEKDGKWSMREDAKKPEDMDDFRINALDLRLTSNTILNYPAIQRLRKSGGSAAGKEISFESDNRLGEVVSGLGINKSNLNTYSNVYEEVLKAPNEKERKKLRKKAAERFQAASEYAQQQTLRGGQRMWSWSDNIERLSPDIAINIMQLQLLGGAMQTYSKQLEGIKLAAQMGAYVNGSLMAKDNGWEEVKDSECYERDGELWLKKDKYDVVNEPRVGKRPRKRKRIIAAKDAHVYQAEDGKKYVLVYDDIVGVDPFGNEHDGKRKKGLFQLNKELDRAGNILVGMNDLHVRAAMADPAVYFVIPWHASGANNHILNEMLEVLGQRMTERLDYTVMQEEKNMLDRNKDTKKLPEVTQRLRDLWEEGRQWAKQNKWKSGMEVDSNGDLITESQYMYRALRGLIFDGSIFEAMPTEEQYQEAVDIVTNMQATVDELNERNEAWKAKSPEYKKSPEGKAEKKEIDDARTKANKAYKPAVHTIELHDGLIDWRDSSVNAEDAEWQAQHPKRINVEEARRIIEADEFLKQVYDRVSNTPGQKMTSGDNTYIYPYEYWQETDAKGKPADIKDADINGKRYVEYCRRMGYKPKFSGNWKTGDVEKQNQGNFVHDPGYWKLLIDRRMYDRNGKYQWLDPVDSDNFETSLVDPRETHKEFHVTTVADDKAADEIAQKVFERLSTRTESGFAAADYNKPLNKIMDEYDAALAAGVQNGKIKLTAAEESMVERMKAATVEEAEETDDSGVMFSSTPAEVSEEEREVLMGIHNITAAKLRSAIGLGGLANPSMAVVDTTKGLLNNFGEISLIPGRDLIDKRKGRNAGTFTADAYTPRFPTVHRRLGKGGEKKLSQWIKSLGMRPEMEYNTQEQFNDWVNGFDIQDNALVYPFLHEKGLSAAVDQEDHNKVSAPFREIVGHYHGDINALMDAFDTNEEVRQEITDIIIDDIVKQEAPREEGESWKDFRERRRKWRQLVNEAYLDFAGFVDRGIAHATLEKECSRYVEASRFNPEATRQAASIYIDKNGMRSEYTQWREQRFAELGVEQQMYAGSDSQGRSKYKPITLESVSKAMKKQGLAGGESSFFSQGPGGVRARLTPRLTSLNQIRAERGRIQSGIDSILEDYSEELNSTISNLFGGDREAAADVLTSSDMKAKAKELGFEIGDATVQYLQDFKNRIIELPTEYFETKFERPVMLNEFEAAVVPNDVDSEIREALEAEGLDVREYDPELAGDRERVTIKAAQDSGKVLFSVSAAEANNAATETDSGIRFSVREKPEPKKTIPVYKLMRLGDDGKLYPLFIDGTEPIELGVWYDADSPNMDMLVDLPIGVHLIDTDNGTSMTMEEYVKQNNIKLKKGQKYPPKEVIESTPNGQRWVYIEPTERGQRRFGGESRRYWNLGINGSGSVSTFSMRPGWHAGSLPTMRQIGKSRVKGGPKTFRDDRFVWVEGLISADIDYNEEAQGNPDNDIPTHIPTDGFYMKATNANAKASQADRVGWYISGAFMPVKIMSDSEARQVIDEWNQDHPDLQVEYDFPRESGKVFNAETMQLEDEANVRFSTGWHGSGSEFDRFDHSHMGEGEGAQAYGWGTYVTSVEGIGRSYATESAKNNPTYYWKGQKIDRASINPLSMAYDVVEREGTIKKAIALVDRFLDNPDAHENWTEVKEILKQSKKSDFTIKPARYLYEVEIPDNDGTNYISWDKVYSVEEVEDILARLQEKGYFTDYGIGDLEGGKETDGSDANYATGEFIYKVLSGAVFDPDFIETDPKKASDALHEIGFVGIEYPAQYLSGGRKDGAKNYVIFNADDAKIVDRVRFSTTAAVDTLKDDERVYNTMLGKVFSGVSNETRRGIVETAMRDMGNDFGAATESWLMGLADNGKFAQVPEDDWRTVKNALSSTLRDMGVDGTMTDNEARYVLWKAGQIEDGVFSMAEDIVMQDRLLPGESGVRFSTSDSREDRGESGEDGIQFSVTPRDRAIVRDQYERYMRNGRLQWVEAMQDSMLGLKKLMQAIMGDEYGYIEDIPTFENPYIAENLMSSATQAQQQAFYVEFIKPLQKEVSKLCKGRRKERERKEQELNDYLMAKHGLERNQVLADRDAQETAQAGGNYQDAYAENRERDYSGLTALTGEDDVHAAEAKAQQMVDDYEAQHDTTELWSKINAATQVTLEKQYKSGMLSYAEYQRISDMFEYYVPLRGWEETTSDEVYGYLTSKAGPFLGGGIVKRAGGRTSKADDPIATIAQMGDDSIRTGNRNLMKQTFLNFVQNHPSDAVSVSDLWLQYDAVTDEWIPVFADIDPNDSADVIAQKIEAFEQHMAQLAQQEPNKYKHGREAANIPYRVIPGMEKEHQVLVKRNGQTWVLTINGNPKAAQALNGLTNPDVQMKGEWASLIKGAEWVNRTLSMLYTTLSPAFIVSNFLRDTGYSNTMVWIRESPNYALRFNANYLKLNPGTLRWLLGKWEEGTLDESKPLQKHFKEFMLNGGETGFAMAQDLEKYKKKMLNEVKNMNSKNFARKSMKVLGSQYELLGRSIENCARFAAYMTSREMGRDVKRSAYDAKEISVNFNKKGSGGKMLDHYNRFSLPWFGALVSGLARSLYTFWNAGVQGMTNFGRAVKRHPVKAALIGAGPLYTAGFLAPILAQMMGAGGDGDDDKNAYYNLPEYVRRSNICIWLGDAWLTIPLPIEFRAIYGMGELTYGVISGNERYTNEELAMQIASQFGQLLPIDMLEGGGGFHPFIPTLFKPIVEAEQNKSWSGLLIYRDSEWNKDEPEYTKAFSNANEWIVSGAEWLNAKTGGDEFKKGWIDLNPAKIEYMLKGYLGGIYTTIDEVRRAAETALGKRDFEWRNIPLANRVIKQGDERTESKKLRDEYFKYKEDYEETKRLINKYKNAEDTDLFDYAKKLDLMNNSKEYGRYLIFEKYATMLDAYQKAKKGASGEVLKKIEEDEKRLMRQLVDEMHAFEDGKTTVNDRPKLSKKDRSEDYGYIYNKLRTYIDINEDALLDSALKRAKAADDKGMVAALNSIKRSIGEMKKGLGHGKDEEVMNSIREMRGSVLSSFGIIGGDEELPEPEEQWQEEPQEEWGEEPEMIEEEPLEEPEDDEFESYE